MSPKIPPEIDSLMWIVAETDDVQAIDEFGERHPEYRSELIKRLSMVRSLRSSRPNGPMPVFRREVARPTSKPRWTTALAGLALAALGFAGYTAVSRNQTPTTPERPYVQPIKDDPIATGGTRPLLTEPRRDPNYHVIDPNEEQPIQQRPAVKRMWERPIEITMSDIGLSTALEAIAMQSGLTMQIAPGMPEVFVQLNYPSMDPMAILKDMGATFGFTIFEQQPGVILIVPEIDKQGTSTTDSGSSHAKVVEPPPGNVSIPR